MTTVLTPRKPVDLLELTADMQDALDRLYTVEERFVRLTATVEALRKEWRELRDDLQLTPKEHIHGVGDVPDGPWSPYLDSIRDIGPIRQRQAVLLPGMWSPYGLTAGEIVSELNARYPDRPMRPPNVYPLLKAMLSHGLLVETPDTKPIRYTVNRRTP